MHFENFQANKKARDQLTFSAFLSGVASTLTLVPLCLSYSCGCGKLTWKVAGVWQLSMLLIVQFQGFMLKSQQLSTHGIPIKIFATRNIFLNSTLCVRNQCYYLHIYIFIFILIVQYILFCFINILKHYTCT